MRKPSTVALAVMALLLVNACADYQAGRLTDLQPPLFDIQPGELLAAEDNTPRRADLSPGTFQTVKTVPFTLAQESELRLEYDIWQFHNCCHHQTLTIRIKIDGTIVTTKTVPWIVGGPVGVQRGSFTTVLDGTFSAGAHTAEVDIGDTGENRLFKIFAKPLVCAAASELVRTEIIDVDYPDQFVIALGGPEPLDAGTSIDELASRAGEGEVILPDRACFFFVDPYPTTNFGHPVEFVTVSVETMQLTRWDAESPPIVNGKVVYNTLQERIESPDLFEPTGPDVPLKPFVFAPRVRGGISAVVASSASPAVLSRANVSQSFAYASNVDPPSPRKVGLVVSGHPDFLPQMAWWKIFLRQPFLGFTPTISDERVEFMSHNLLPEGVTSLKAKIKAMTMGLGDGDLFVLVLGGHGYSSKQRNDQWHFTLGTDPNNKKSIIVSTGDLITILDEITASEVMVIIESCFSGRIFRDLNVPVLKQKLKAAIAPGQEISFFVSADAKFSSETFPQSGSDRVPTVLREFFEPGARTLSFWGVSMLKSVYTDPMVWGGIDNQVSIDDFKEAMVERQKFAQRDRDVKSKPPKVGVYRGVNRRKKSSNVNSHVLATFDPNRSPANRRDIIVRTNGFIWQDGNRNGVLFEVLEEQPALGLGG